MPKKTYENALNQVAPRDPDTYRETYMLHSLAGKIDDTRQEVIEAAERVERDMMRLRRSYEEGQYDTSNPLNSSSLTDLPALIAKHETSQRAFWDVAQMVLNQEKFQELQTAVKAAA